MKRKYRSAEVQITSFSKHANGIGSHLRDDGSSVDVEVPFTAPGDLVRAQLLRKRHNCFSSRLEEILKPSPQRITPRCVHFASCGGCRLQHISYESQLQFKEALVHSCFEKLISSDVSFLPIIPCISPWQYRNKMEYSFTQSAAGDKFLGLIADGSKGKALNLTECFLTSPWFVEALKSVRSWWQESELGAYRPFRDTGSLRTLTLREGRRSGDRMAILTVSGNPDFSLKQSHLDGFVAAIRRVAEPIEGCQLSIFLRIQQIKKGMATNNYEMRLYGSDHIREILHIAIDKEKPPIELTFHVSPSAFFQPNSSQAEILYSTALRLANIDREAVVYDLYCGTGALGLSIASRVKQVVGVEISPEAALDARTNAEVNQYTNVKIISGNVRHILKNLKEEQISPPDLVMIDPPRPGLDPEAMQNLIELQPPKILYVSCNPTTQAVNVAEFVKNGFKIKAIQPIDQFPQTAHVENVVVLSRE